MESPLSILIRRFRKKRISPQRYWWNLDLMATNIILYHFAFVFLFSQSLVDIHCLTFMLSCCQYVWWLWNFSDPFLLMLIFFYNHLQLFAFLSIYLGIQQYNPTRSKTICGIFLNKELNVNWYTGEVFVFVKLAIMRS